MINVKDKVFTPEERQEGFDVGRKMAIFYGRPMFVTWRVPFWKGSSPWDTTSTAPKPQDDNPANGKVIQPSVPLGWVHPDWTQVTFSRFPDFVVTVWPNDIAPEIRYAWGEAARDAMPYGKTEYFQRTVKAGGEVVLMWVGMCRGYRGDLSQYPEMTLEVVEPVTADA